MLDVDKYLDGLRSEKLRRAVKIQSEIIQTARDFLKEQGFVEILPVIISPITDPLLDFRIRGEIECYGFKYQLTKSMIFHKQIALHSVPRVFSFSPNVRIEPSERKTSGKHLIEFVQLDLEAKEASREEVIRLGERLVVTILENIKATCQEDLEFFEREIKVPSLPFPSLTHREAVQRFGQDYETPLSQSLSQPLWLLDFPVEEREFYDLEYPDRPDVCKDMDLIYPEGYGEALSGGEREFEPDKIKKRMERKGIDVASYELYIQFAERGLFPSAGFGIGVERLTRYICGLESIELTRLFAKLPGIFGL